MSNSMKFLNELVEITNLRLQVDDVLIQCLEINQGKPLFEFVEDMILLNPQAAYALQAILSETKQKRKKTKDLLEQLLSEVNMECSTIGIKVKNLIDLLTVGVLTAKFNQEEGQLKPEQADDKNRSNFFNVIVKYVDLITQLRLLMDIEQYLIDWLWGMGYESYHNNYPLANKKTTVIL